MECYLLWKEFDYKLIEDIITDDLSFDYSTELEQLSNFEYQLKKYTEGDKKEPKYYRISFDIVKERTKSVYEAKECTVKVSYENDKLRVEKVKIEHNAQKKPGLQMA